MGRSRLFFVFLIPLLLPLPQSTSQSVSQSALNRSHNFNGCGEFVALLSGSVASFMDPDRHLSARAELLFLCVCSGVNEVNKFIVYFCFLHKKRQYYEILTKRGIDGHGQQWRHSSLSLVWRFSACGSLAISIFLSFLLSVDISKLTW